MPAVIVIGAQWGDEGKGKIADHLAKRADMVVRYQGGNNAGHTVVVGDTTLKLHQVPAGITRPDVIAIMGHGMVVNPPALVEELDIIEKKGITIDNLYISGNAHVVMPYHPLLDELEEELRGDQSLGTTKRGIGPAYTDKYARRGLRMQDIVDEERFTRCVQNVLQQLNPQLEGVFGVEALMAEELVADYAPAIARLAPYVTDTDLLVQNALDRDEKLLLEGAQGTMLDIDYGTYPYVTSSSPTAGGACQGSGISPVQIEAVLGVVKAYTSRVGTGPFPSELTDETGDWLVEHGHEYGTTTGRRRRCGWIDLVALRYAARVNGFTGLAITRLDILSGLEELKLCVGYRWPDGTVSKDYPNDTERLAQMEPVYESMPGWDDDITDVRQWEELPTRSQRYCQRISDWLGVPIDLVSVGPERNELIALRWPL